ncbi:MAG: hypothetical protein CL610_20560 [Anaerolineaceae bacterium]|nr:hypothetical protein [Anaerolineaceae bacterium]
MSPLSFEQATRRILLLTFVANLWAALAIWFYVAFIGPLPGTELAFSGQINKSLVFLVFVVTLPLAATWLTWWHLLPIVRWEEGLRRGGTMPSRLPDDLASRVLNWVRTYSVGTFIGWLAVGVLLMLVGVISFRTLLGVLLAAIIATSLVFLGSELIWRNQMPLFFPAGNLSQHEGFRLPVFNRLLIVLSLLTLVPLVLFFLSIDRSMALLATAQGEGVAAVVRNLIALQILILLVGLTAGGTLAIFFARSILGPLKALEQAMLDVEQNKLNVHVPVISKDELGYLGERFNQMIDGLRRAEQLRQLLGLYASPEVAQAALEGGTALSGTLCHCSMMFTDVREFTALAEKLEPEALVDLVNRYMTAMIPPIISHGGVITRFGGDSILAVFGSPLNPSDTHSSQAVRAAWAMRTALAHFNADQRRNGGPQISHGIGIASGAVVIGNVGGKERVEYTVMGEAANLAARLEAGTKYFERPMLISAATYAALEPSQQPKFTEIPDVIIRGKATPVTIYAYEEGFSARTQVHERLQL